MNNENLKPCPFCGGEVIHMKMPSVSGTVMWVRIYHDADIQCGVDFRAKEDVAFDQWNKRPKLIDRPGLENQRPSPQNYGFDIHKLLWTSKSRKADYEKDLMSYLLKVADFGKRCKILENRYDSESEYFHYKIVGRMQSNRWVDIPAQYPSIHVLHDEVTNVALCIEDGVGHSEVKAFRLIDLQDIE